MWGHNVNEVREIADLRGETQVLFHGRLATNETSPKKKKKEAKNNTEARLEHC